jgi:shikimate kinase
MHPRIFLIGFMGSGKSTHGSKLARKIGYSYVDMDRLIEETAGTSIPVIFREYGEAVFRKWEHDVLIELCRREKVVVSTGGGAPCHNDMIRIMNEQGCTIYLRLTPAALADRLKHSNTERPLIRGITESKLPGFIENLLGEREMYYRQARFTVDGEHLQTERLIELVRGCS